MNTKTKKVSGLLHRVDLSSKSFAWVGDENDTATWLVPLFDPTSAANSKHLVSSALSRVNEVKGIPDSAFESVRLLVIGAALAHGIDVKRPTADEAAAWADIKATEMLRALGLE